MTYTCKEVIVEKDKNLFLNLPKKIYTKEYLFNNRTTEKQILNGSHVLSKDFTIYPFIVVDEEDNIYCRAILFKYPDEEKGYVGFFESVNNFTAVEYLFYAIKKQALKEGLKSLIGPINGSIWLGYRFKVDNFDNYYTGEPFNLWYYKEFWEQVGFTVRNRYFSNQMKVPDSKDERSVKILEKIKNKGYKIENMKYSTFNTQIKEIYNLIMNVYSDFPCYRSITESQFISMYGYIKNILNYDMAMVAYKDGELKGFSIAIPNYSNYISILNLSNLTNILKIRKNPKEYVILYLGCAKDSIGLGVALAELTKEYLESHQCTSVVALVHEGNTPGKYYENMKVNQYHYELYEMNIM